MNKEKLFYQKAKLEAYINFNVCPKKARGLCDNVLSPYVYWNDVFRSWFWFSGSTGFPVEGDSRAYTDKNNKKHDRTTRYGKLRLSLAKHCLQHVLTELRELQS